MPAKRSAAKYVKHFQQQFGGNTCQFLLICSGHLTRAVNISEICI